MKRLCDRCHKRKELCRGENPCDRCSKDRSECTYDRAILKNGRKRGPEKIHPRGKYSKNGCVACRKQKKKCDEVRPQCGNCVHRQRVCVYGQGEIYGGVPKLDTAKPEELKWTPPVGETADQLPTKTFTPDLSTQILSPSTFFSTTEKMFLDLLLDLTLLGEVQLEQLSPSDAGGYEEQKLNLLTLCMLNTVGIPDPQRELLCYFIDEVSMLLFSDKTTTRFLGTVIPLCLVDHRVRYPILAIASSHRLNKLGHSDYEIMRDAVKYRGMAQCCLADRNSDFFDDTENVLLGLCLVLIQEIFEGNSLYWSSALQKGSEVIQARGGLKKVSKISPLLIQLFCYLDHVSSLSTCATPHVDRSRNNPYFNYSGNHVEDILNCKFGFRYGIAGELFKIMGNISTLAGLRSVRHNSPEHEKQFDSLANLIEMKLQNWAPSHIDLADNFSLDGDLDSRRMNLSSYWLALQWSCFLRLHQIKDGYNRRDSRVSACLLIILRSLKSIESTTEIETGLMFPLIMAGCVSVELADRNYILSRIRSIKEKLRFNYIGEFEKLLHAVWDKDESEGDCVNWAKIRFYQFPGLVMF